MTSMKSESKNESYCSLYSVELECHGNDRRKYRSERCKCFVIIANLEKYNNAYFFVIFHQKILKHEMLSKKYGIILFYIL